MSRYESEFMGITAGFAAPEGLDPNYHNGYRGMRMVDGGRQAAYGAQRLGSAPDLETVGGFDGVHWPLAAASRPHRLEEVGETAAWMSGGVRDPFRDHRFMRDFNANSPALDAPEIAEESAPPLPVRYGDPPIREGEYQPGYGNRGVPSAGFGEAWARGPMRGSR